MIKVEQDALIYTEGAENNAENQPQNGVSNNEPEEPTAHNEQPVEHTTQNRLKLEVENYVRMYNAQITSVITAKELLTIAAKVATEIRVAIPELSYEHVLDVVSRTFQERAESVRHQQSHNVSNEEEPIAEIGQDEANHLIYDLASDHGSNIGELPLQHAHCESNDALSPVIFEPRPNDLLKVSGRAACTMFLKKAGNYPTFYRAQMSPNLPFNAISRSAQTDFKSIVKSVQNRHRTVTYALCWHFWRNVWLEPKSFQNGIHLRHVKYLPQASPVAEEDINEDTSGSEKAKSSPQFVVPRTKKERDVLGAKVQDTLAHFMQFYPDVYEIQLDKTSPLRLVREIENWNGVLVDVASVHENVPEQFIFDSWKTLRSRYFRNTCASRFKGKIGYLEQLKTGSAAQYITPVTRSTRRGQLNPQPEARPQPAPQQNAPNNISCRAPKQYKRLPHKEKLVFKYGQAALDTMLAEIGKRRRFYSIYVHGCTLLQEVTNVAGAEWREIMNVMESKYPGVSERCAFTAWRSVRSKYHTEQCPKRLKGKLTFLDKLPVQLQQRRTRVSQQSHRSFTMRQKRRRTPFQEPEPNHDELERARYDHTLPFLSPDPQPGSSRDHLETPANSALAHLVEPELFQDEDVPPTDSAQLYQHPAAPYSINMGAFPHPHVAGHYYWPYAHYWSAPPAPYGWPQLSVAPHVPNFENYECIKCLNCDRCFIENSKKEAVNVLLKIKNHATEEEFLALSAKIQEHLDGFQERERERRIERAQE